MKALVAVAIQPWRVETKQKKNMHEHLKHGTSKNNYQKYTAATTTMGIITTIIMTAVVVTAIAMIIILIMIT